MGLPATSERSTSLVVKSNQLINAEYRLSPIEMKIIYLMAIQIQPGDEDFKTYYLRIDDFRKELRQKSNRALYSRMVDIVNRLMQRVIKIEDDNGDVEQFHFVTYSKTKNANGTIAMRFVPELKPHLIELKAHFTSFYDFNVLFLKSAFSMRIYEFLCQYVKIGHRTMEVEEIKRKLQISNKYRSYYTFKQKVLVKAQEDLKEHTDISFEFEEIKQGKRVNEIKFTIHRKRSTVSYQKQKEEEKAQGDCLSDIEKDLVSMGLTKTQIKQLLEAGKVDCDNLRTLIQLTQERYKQGKVNNPAAYIFRLISTGVQATSDFEKHVTEEKEQQKEKEQQSRNRKAILNKLRHDYEAQRQQLITDKVGDFSEDDWKAFEEYAHNLPEMFRGDLVKNGKLNTQSVNLNAWSRRYMDSTLPHFEQAYEDYVLQKTGWIIQKSKYGEGEYEIIGTQQSLFE